MDHYAVIGNPIAHSLSPEIFAHFAMQTGESIVYARILSSDENFKRDVELFRHHGGHGLNITVPFKQKAFEMTAVVTPVAEQAGAVNTLTWLDTGVWQGHNTDGAGLVQDLVQYYKMELKGASILILGAGGATRGIIAPLAALEPDRLMIANRTMERAQALCHRFASMIQINALPYDQLFHEHFDLIINATSTSLHNTLPPFPDTMRVDDALCYDLVYAAQPTPFMRWAQQRGAVQCVDGLGMLVEQAAASFKHWRGIMPATDALRAHLRARMTQNNPA